MDAGQVKEFDSPWNLLGNPNSAFSQLLTAQRAQIGYVFTIVMSIKTKTRNVRDLNRITNREPVVVPGDSLASIREKFNKNYYGLPIHALQQSSAALIYQSRKPLQEDVLDEEDASLSRHHVESEKSGELSSRKNHDSSVEQKADANVTAQRKVATALLTMVKNEQMIKHFLFKGGLDAVMKLIQESSDMEVQLNCAQSLIQASSNQENCKVLLDKNVFQAVTTFVDTGDDQLKHLAAIILANLSCAKDLEDRIAFNNILGVVQAMLTHIHRADTICFLLLSLSNVSPALLGPDAELTARICFQATKKLDVVRFQHKAIFIADMYNNYTRVNHYNLLLVEEGVLPLLLHLMDTHPVEEMLKKTTEALANLSYNRKNRREIAGCGIANRLNTVFDNGLSQSKAHILLLMGNLLSSGLFHDKVANEATISNILDNLLDLQHPKQFNAVAFCLCQLSKNETSCAALVHCGVIPIVLGFLRQAPKESLDYLWFVLVNVTHFDQFLGDTMKQIDPLIRELYEEVRFDASSLRQRQAVTQIAFNLSRNLGFSNCLDTELMTMFVKTLKIIFASPFYSQSTEIEIQFVALICLINFAEECVASRSVILGHDLLQLFTDVGIDTDDKLNVKYVGLMNIISNEDSCCYKLLELGAQKFIVSLQDSFDRLSSGTVVQRKKPKSYKKGQSISNLSALIKSTGIGLADSGQFHIPVEQRTTETYEYDPVQEGKLGKRLSAATLHNIALKRPVLAPGLLIAIFSMAKNSKDLQVLHCIRALACMSAHPKSKIALSKEARRMIPMLTVIMRCGCEEAEKVQHYCASILCNVLAIPLEKPLLHELVKTQAIVDLVVVTLLRINTIETKETLGKALFNLLCRSEIREKLIMDLDMLTAVIELSKIENADLLELCIRIIYNLTCDLRAGSGFEAIYASKLQQLKVPHLMTTRMAPVGSINYKKEHGLQVEGSMPSKQVRFLVGMAIANLSFNKSLVLELTKEREYIAKALHRIFVLNSDEATFCAVATLYNISTIPECRVLSNTNVLNLIVEVLEKECTLVCTKLCTAAMCNFSMIAVFHEPLSTIAMASIVKIIASPHFHMSVKLDAIQTVYNLVTLYEASRTPFIEADGVVALWKLLKVQGGNIAKEAAAAVGSVGGDDSVGAGTNASSEPDMEGEESTLHIIGHIVKELCDDVVDLKVQKKMLTDGMMNIVLKLSKIELPYLKLDMSFAIYSMSKFQDMMRVLKWDAVDILFWLTLHDTLNLHDTISRNVARSLRCFSSSQEEGKVLVKQDRFFSVLKALVKSKNEDVLWQTSGTLYNLMHVNQCLKLLVDRGLIGYIFEMAASGFESVKHVCSACLHMVPDKMPNLEDPLVLELVLCLLEAQGDKFSEISDKPNDTLPYDMVTACYAGSSFKFYWTDFTPSWGPLSCVVDTNFTPALIRTPFDSNMNVAVQTLDSAGFSTMEPHQKIFSTQYRDFHREIVYHSSTFTGNTPEGEAIANLQNRHNSMSQKEPLLPSIHVARQYEADEDDIIIEDNVPFGAPPPIAPPNQTVLDQELYTTAEEGPHASKSSKSIKFDHHGGGGHHGHHKLHHAHSTTNLHHQHGSRPGSRHSHHSGHESSAAHTPLSKSSTVAAFDLLGKESPKKLPLIGQPKNLPSDTLDAIKKTISKDTQSILRKSGGSAGASGGTVTFDQGSLENVKIGEAAFGDSSVLDHPSSAGPRRRSKGNNNSQSVDSDLALPAGLLTAASRQASTSMITHNKHGNFTKK